MDSSQFSQHHRTIAVLNKGVCSEARRAGLGIAETIAIAFRSVVMVIVREKVLSSITLPPQVALLSIKVVPLLRIKIGIAEMSDIHNDVFCFFDLVS